MTILLLILVAGLAAAGLVGVFRLVSSDGIRRAPICDTRALER